MDLSSFIHSVWFWFVETLEAIGFFILSMAFIFAVFIGMVMAASIVPIVFRVAFP